MRTVVDKLFSLLTWMVGLSVIFFCLVNIVALSAILFCLVGIEAVMRLIPSQFVHPQNKSEAGTLPDMFGSTPGPKVRSIPIFVVRRAVIGKRFGELGVNPSTQRSDRPVRVEVLNGQSEQDPLSA